MGVSTWPRGGRNKRTITTCRAIVNQQTQEEREGKRTGGADVRAVDRRAVLEHAEVDPAEMGVVRNHPDRLW
jgi:hypothetical protein